MNPAYKPMLATLVEEPFDDKRWVFETKWDGFRLVTEKRGHAVRLVASNVSRSIARTVTPIDCSGSSIGARFARNAPGTRFQKCRVKPRGCSVMSALPPKADMVQHRCNDRAGWVERKRNVRFMMLPPIIRTFSARSHGLSKVSIFGSVCPGEPSFHKKISRERLVRYSKTWCRPSIRVNNK